ncbi:MAG: glycosyltransferase [Balneolia bacterium]|nr:glycosyltransferase [Balneolia bacterium]
MSTNGTIIKKPTLREKLTLRILIVFGLLSMINFFYWFLAPEFMDYKLLYWLLIALLGFDSFRVIYIWYHYWDISVPEKPVLTKNLTVDVLTTYFPGEPYDMIENTLLAIKRMRYPHTTYLCDEANDAHLKEFCKQHGIVHVTRDNRINAKAGNINNALKQATGDICLILDPDHVPKENFLEDILPYFEDDKIGFVQSVQAYYNVDESRVAKAAAEQTFHFYGPVMMTMNSYGTVNAIGANCIFRRKALDSIGGHAAGLSEDMHTAMQLYAKGWKSVYVPEIFTKGLVPATLTSYYKQQLKWSRGTLELLVSVLPKLFSKFTWRQRIHFGILPLHYLSGLVVLICLLIPIISLFAAATPWKGNIINFGFIVTPVLASVLAIRLFVQRWVMHKSEWGTHFLGGLLQACTWWIFVIGFVYTIIRKKVPYLPTPKEDNERTSWIILMPNIIVGVISIVAIFYGLSIDLTPFSMFMSGFALLNAGFMFYTLVFAFEKPKPVKPTFEFPEPKKTIVTTGKYMMFSTWQKAALPLVILISAIAIGFYYQAEYVKWEGVQAEPQEKNVINYIGIFAPEFDDGITSLEIVRNISDEIDENFDIISFYLAWDKDLDEQFPAAMVDSIYINHSIPMITWEPWLNTFENQIEEDDHVYDLIAEGFFDSFIGEFADKLRDLDRPVFLRFAHEFDNPFYPWYMSGDEAGPKFRAAWIHAYEIFKEREAHNVIWIWNPWKPENMLAAYPGREYVDWIGLNILDYGTFSEGGSWYDFRQLYQPYHNVLRDLPLTPVVIAEFGTLRGGSDQSSWVENAFDAIENNFSEIKSVVYFNSSVDKNWPEGMEPDGYLDWTIPKSDVIKSSFRSKEVPDYVFSAFPALRSDTLRSGSNLESDSSGYSGNLNSNPDSETNSENGDENEVSSSERSSLEGTKGINLKYSNQWRRNYHVLSRRKLMEDFERITNLGFDTIKITGNSIYVHNILNISREFNLDVSYGFWVSSSIDFLYDAERAEKLHESIVREVKQHKDKPHISSWNIQNDVLYNQKDFFHKPELLHQNRAYIIWLNNLIADIKKLDSSRPIILNLEVNLLSLYHSQLLYDNVDGLDYFGLTVKETEHLDWIVRYFKESEKPYVFSEINAQTLVHPMGGSNGRPFFVTSWQDQHESNKLTFDGIIDRKGRARAEYFQLKEYLNDTEAIAANKHIRILKPALAVHSGNFLDYYAKLYDEDEGWVNGSSLDGFSFEWSLVKTDENGNYLAVRDIHSGPNLRLRIPQNHEYFRLLLTVSDGQEIATDLTPLNIPLID